MDSTRFNLRSTPRSGRLALVATHGNTANRPSLSSYTSSNDVKPTETLSSSPSPYMSNQYRRQSSAGLGANAQMQALEVGDTVEVPGGMTGTVRYIGNVRGKAGEFAGIELGEEDAARGKNDGDVDGIHYFRTAIPGSGIFLPASRAIRVGPPRKSSAVGGPPRTPIARKIAGHVDTPTPGVPSFSQSVGPGARPPFAQSISSSSRPPSPPQSKLRPRPSLPRPASPTRKTPVPTLHSRPSVGTFRPPASPLPQRISKPSTPLPPRVQSRAQSRATDHYADDITPTGISRPSIGGRGLSNLSHNAGGNEEIRRLQKQLEERDKELDEYSQRISEQTSTVQQLNASLASFKNNSQSHHNTKAPSEATDIAHLRAQLREKDDTIMSLRAEFEAHRSNFRDTIDALEAASAETERVYSARIQELEQQVEELRADREDMMAVTDQFAQLESMVLELEEGLDDARRSQSEERRKVEELEGELERTRLELRQERENAESAAAGNSESVNSGTAQELEHKHDEIRGLKAIIQSLTSSKSQHPSTPPSSHDNTAEVDRLRAANHDLEAELVKKSKREEDLITENARLQSQSSKLDSTLAEPQTPPLSGKSFDRPSSASSSPKRTMGSPSSTANVRPFARDHDSLASFLTKPAITTLASRFRGEPSSSSLTDSSADGALWCEICEQAGHDVLSCSNVLDYDGQSRRDSTLQLRQQHDGAQEDDGEGAEDQFEDTRTSSTAKISSPEIPSTVSTTKSPETVPASAQVEETPIWALPGETGPAPGKRTQRIDMNKWCAFCERDGHDSVDCPFEEEL